MLDLLKLNDPFLLLLQDEFAFLDWQQDPFFFFAHVLGHSLPVLAHFFTSSTDSTVEAISLDIVSCAVILDIPI